ncbi:MAG: PepSY-associated TM helix domain-containing protein [Bacteroidota bacterium]
MKKILGWLHLYLGLVAGLVVFVSMLGAAIFAWEEELTNWYYADLVYADTIGTETLPPSQLYAAVEAAYPGKNFTFLKVDRAPNKNYALRSYKGAEEPGWTWASGVAHYYVSYVNPYTGKVAGHIDKKRDWIMLARFLHQNLLLKHSIGTQIVGAAALIMVALALSGLYLWWPKNRKILRQRLKIKWGARFKRVNWDYHSVGGFYTHLFILFFACTGLVWSYKWWSNSVYRMLGNDPKEVFVRPKSPQLDGCDQTAIIDLAFADAQTRRPDWYKLYLNVPRAKSKKGTISARLYFHHPESWWETNDVYYYHPETGALHHAHKHDEKLLGEKWRNSNYAMHVGSIYGWPTKVIASLCALFFATLPISGFLIWWGRKKKKSRSASRKTRMDTIKPNSVLPRTNSAS